MNESGKTYFVIKDPVKLNFKISEKFQGGTINFAIPVSYAVDEKSAAKSESLIPFLFSKPRTILPILEIAKELVADLTPPFV